MGVFADRSAHKSSRAFAFPQHHGCQERARWLLSALCSYDGYSSDGGKVPGSGTPLEETGAAVGGLLGAAGGAGAAIGAVTGGLGGGAFEGITSEERFKHAFRACMRERGYTVLD
jgi:hypothetical protein